MKIDFSFFVIFLIASVQVSYASANELSKNHAALLMQGCQMGIDDLKSGKSMDSSGISLKDPGGKYNKLEALIRQEYEKCYIENSPIGEITQPPVIESGSRSRVIETSNTEGTNKIQVNNQDLNITEAGPESVFERTGLSLNASQLAHFQAVASKLDERWITVMDNSKIIVAKIA